MESKTVAKIFVILTFLFGFINCFVTYPISNGDEGFHLSKTYSMFSSHHPQELNESNLRSLELVAIKPERTDGEFSAKSFYLRKIDAVKDDKVKMNLLTDSNLIARIDLAHIPAALGVLLGRMIYPSYGVMMLFGRLFNLIFFCLCLYFIIRRSKVGNWSLLLLFTVPFIQKMTSLSYDVFCYIIAAAIMVEFLNQMKDLIEKKQSDLLVFGVLSLLILFCKNNYILLMVCWLIYFFSYLEVKQITYRFKVYIFSIVALLAIFVVFAYYIDFLNYIKVFINSYLNPVTMQRRGFQLFNVVPVILPDIFNIIWIVSLTIVLIGEKGYWWNHITRLGMLILFMLNWLLIYTGFYFILGKPDHAFDDLSGRYLHPFIICFMPIAQSFSYSIGIVVKAKYLKIISISTVSIVYFAYLLMVFYRGYVAEVTPTWR